MPAHGAARHRTGRAAGKKPDRACVVTKANCTRLVTDPSGAVVGVECSKDGAAHAEMGPVVLCTGGFGADLSDSSLLQEVESEWCSLKAWDPVKQLPALRFLPTTNGEHCTGDGIKMGLVLGANTVHMEAVQVHPTGLVDPATRTARSASLLPRRTINRLKSIHQSINCPKKSSGNLLNITQKSILVKLSRRY